MVTSQKCPSFPEILVEEFHISWLFPPNSGNLPTGISVKPWNLVYITSIFNPRFDYVEWTHFSPVFYLGAEAAVARSWTHQPKINPSIVNYLLSPFFQRLNEVFISLPQSYLGNN